MRPPPPLAVTMGEPAGIGGEITLLAWLGREAGLPCFFMIDDADRLERLAASLGLSVPIRRIGQPADAASAIAGALPVLHRPLPRPPVPGRLDPANAKAVIAAIEEAVTLVRGGEAAAVVTNPIHKKALYGAGFAFPGHTEFLADLAGGDARAVMMLAIPGLRVVPVTVHLPLRQAIASLDAAMIRTAAEAVDAALRRDFAIARPRLKVAGLNPHAGEDGALGEEDAAIVAPAAAALRAAGIDAEGPVPPDALFTPRAREGYDAAICLYHDQALIPLKALDVDHGVNITLGLPFVRTSPDHGTALDIAGAGIASPSSLMAALTTAADLARNRAAASP
ncbi:MAG: 4-hydroxythreonine-4-phosphate dehydrogenase PdxA [Rhodospirillales bacterium]|nr:4-hydroxythreonine-4-phosphate dehydrogenase PdxA [Rhodospirillales bacterium]